MKVHSITETVLNMFFLQKMTVDQISDELCVSIAFAHRIVAPYMRSIDEVPRYAPTEIDMINRSSDEQCIAMFNSPTFVQPSFPELLRQALDKTNQ